jgi:hypothetical protein
MNEQTFRPVSLAPAAVLIGGVLIALMPRHALNILRLIIVTIAASAGLHALGMNSPPTWWSSPFDRKVRWPWARRGFDEIEWIRDEMSGWRQRIHGSPPLPPEVVRLIRPLIESAIGRHGFDATDVDAGDPIRRLVSPLTWVVLTADIDRRVRWYRMVPPDRAEVASAVHEILDDIDRLNGTPDTHQPTATGDS